MPRYSLDLHGHVIHACKQHGATIHTIAQTFQISANTALSEIKLNSETDQLQPKPQRGDIPSRLMGKEYLFDEIIALHRDYNLVEY